MIRTVSTAFAIFALSVAAFAGDGGGSSEGQVEFTMPSNNVGCIYTPAGGTSTYSTADGGAELQCDRVEPSYVRVILGASGRPKKYTNVGDASCCSANDILSYGEVWAEGPFSCISAASGLTCTRGSHGFSMSRKAIKVY